MGGYTTIFLTNYRATDDVPVPAVVVASGVSWVVGLMAAVAILVHGKLDGAAIHIFRALRIRRIPIPTSALIGRLSSEVVGDVALSEEQV